MALQFSVPARNARADALETAIGPDALLRILDGTLPANCAAADDGTPLVNMTLPTDWLTAASSGSKAKAGTWEDAEADEDGDAAYFRVYDSTGATCHIQGSAGPPGSGADLILDNAAIATGQTVTITAFTLTEGGG